MHKCNQSQPLEARGVRFTAQLLLTYVRYTRLVNTVALFSIYFLIAHILFILINLKKISF